MPLTDRFEPEPTLRTTTSLTFDAVRHAFRVNKPATKIAILDCCCEFSTVSVGMVVQESK